MEIKQPFQALRPEARHSWRQRAETQAFRQQLELLRDFYDRSLRTNGINGETVKATADAARVEMLEKVCAEMDEEPEHRLAPEDEPFIDPATRPSLRPKLRRASNGKK